MAQRRRHMAEFKAGVVKDVMREVDTLSAIAARHGVHPSQVRDWRRQAEESMVDGFRQGKAKGGDDASEALKEATPRSANSRWRRIFLSCVGALSKRERLARIEADSPLGISRQCRLLGVARRSYYRPAPRMSAADLDLMRRIDEKHMAHPFYGSRQMKRALALDGVDVGRRKVRRLMRIMGAVAVAPKPMTSVKAPTHKVFPYRLRGLAVTEANHVWCADITYVPMRGGFMYLVAVMDWATRFVLAWRLSNSMDAGFCLDALAEALRGGVAPAIFNTDQGSQFTSEAFTGAVLASGAEVSMDGRGRWLDNRFIERLWRSLKCEAVHLRELTDGVDAHRVIGAWIDFHNDLRPHSALRGATPRVACEGVSAAWRKAA